MASSAWLPQETHSSTSQSSASASGGSSTIGHPMPTAPIVAAPTTTSAASTGTTTTATGTDSAQEPAQQAKFVAAPGYVSTTAPTPSPSPSPSFSFNVHLNVSTSSGGLQQSSTSPVLKSNSPASSAFLQPPAPGLSGNTGPSFSYNIPISGLGFPGGQQSQSGTNSSVDVVQESCFLSTTTSVSQSFSQPAHTSTSTATAVSLSHNLGPVALRIPTAPSFHVPQGMSGTPLTPGPPGISSSLPLPSNLTVPSAAVDSSSSALLRSTAPAALFPPNPAVQHQAYPPYPSVAPVAASSQGLWLPTPHLSGLPRPPFLPYPATFPGPFPLPPHGMSLRSVPLPDAQPPGVTPLGTSGGTPMSSLASVPHLTTSSGMPQETPPGIDNGNQANDGVEDGTVGEHLEAWTAHKTETGVVYYYNAVTGESTYEKPAGYRGEPDKVTAQPTPVSWEKLAGTDWALVTTNDGKKYYYNTKTKLSSWQIPTELTDLRKKQDVDAVKEQSMSVPNANVLTEKGSAPISLSAPAVNTGGRDATALRVSGGLGLSSALDLIKKKLQDSGAPATSSPVPALSGPVALESNGSRAAEATVKGPQSENSKDKLKDADGDGNMSDSSSDSEDVDSGPTKEDCIIQFKEMLKERGVAPFSKWEKELPKIVFDPRFKAIPGYSARRALFEHYVRTRAEEERKEKRAAQKAAIEGFKQLLEDAKQDIDHNMDYQTFKMKWGHDPRFEALDRKDRELLLNERVLPLKRAAEEKTQAIRAAAASSFKSMLREKADITISSRWSKVKDSLRNDPRYKSVKHEAREILFKEYIAELKLAEEEAEQAEKAKLEEQEKLKERERALRKRKEREEQEVERVRSKARRKEAIESYQALLVETIKDPQASWTESRPKLEKDPQGRAANPYLDQSDLEKLFREHVKISHERCVHEFRALLSDVITSEVGAEETKEGKTALTSWSTAKRLLKADPRYTKMPRKERESLWRRHVEDIQQQRKRLGVNQEGEREKEKLGAAETGRSRRPVDYWKYHP